MTHRLGPSICTTPGCPNDQPCPTHGRKGSWNPRDNAAQNRFRKAVLTRDQHRCVKCGSADELVAHHVKPGYHVSVGITLCGKHHRELDSHAR